MQITGAAYRLLQISLIVLIVMLCVAAAWWYLMVPKLQSERLEIEKDFLQYIASGGVYHSRVQSYDGVCGGMILPRSVTCIENEDYYMIYTRLSDRSYYCADSTGYKGKQFQQPNRRTCQ